MRFASEFSHLVVVNLPLENAGGDVFFVEKVVLWTKQDDDKEPKYPYDDEKHGNRPESKGNQEEPQGEHKSKNDVVAAKNVPVRVESLN